ncbi:Thioredoxin [Penicillium malachiteum]|uniref:protein disulfide-isomerase n=1 Tax=Penicillium malachiteum TaxID=1324776 RepID=A0AAD6HHR0_9EURO|nr:Thioredoxin [Penicillium malachiteum]
MLPQSSTFLFLASLLAVLPVNADGIYSNKSPVLQVNQKTYGSLIANSNHTSIVEFYAPWCGHCKNLKPAYEKAAQNLNGLAKVAAVNCDEDENKPFCGQMGVQGFPTLKIVTPSKKAGRPHVQDYQGPRTAKGIVDAVVNNIPNHVKKATDKNLDNWLEQNEERPKAILFTEKGTTSSLIRALAIDFLDVIDIAQVRNKESSSVEKFGIEEFPTLVVIPSGDSEYKVYDGELKKQPILDFLSKFAEPNPDATGKAAPANRPKAKPKSKPASKSASDDGDNKTSTETPESKPTPASAPPIPTLATPETLESACLAVKSNTCVLALLPATGDESELPAPATEALSSLAEIAHKHALRGVNLFPVHAIPDINTASENLRSVLGLNDSQTVELIAVNARRGWWRRFSGEEFGLASVESWIDAIRLGEGSKEKLPEGLVAEAEPKTETPKEEAEHDEL